MWNSIKDWYVCRFAGTDLDPPSLVGSTPDFEFDNGDTDGSDGGGGGEVSQGGEGETSGATSPKSPNPTVSRTLGLFLLALTLY